MSLHVRSLTITEGKKIQRLLRHSKSRVIVRRAQVILLSDQGMLAEKIAQVTLMHPEYVRELMRQFNTVGMKIFIERKRPSRPVIFNYGHRLMHHG